jgi:hypothetical protein
MQFAYQFPEMTERLVLASSGGLGPEVSSLLRAATLPGAKLFIAATAGPGQVAGSVLARGIAAVGLRPHTEVAEVARGYASQAEIAPRHAGESGVTAARARTPSARHSRPAPATGPDRPR